MPRSASRMPIGARRLSGTHAATSIPAATSSSGSRSCHVSSRTAPLRVEGGEVGGGEGLDLRGALLEQHAAVDDDVAAGDVGGVVGGEEHGGPGHVVGGAGPLE